LPLWEEYEEQIKSEVADIKNVGGRPAGTITGGTWADKDKPYIPKGATGIGVRLIVQLLQEWEVSS